MHICLRILANSCKYAFLLQLIFSSNFARESLKIVHCGADDDIGSGSGAAKGAWNYLFIFLLAIRFALALDESESLPFRYCSMTSPAIGAARSAPNPPCST